MSKGSTQRPIKVDKKTFESNWDRIFSKKNNYKGHWLRLRDAHLESAAEAVKARLPEAEAHAYREVALKAEQGK